MIGEALAALRAQARFTGSAKRIARRGPRRRPGARRRRRIGSVRSESSPSSPQPGCRRPRSGRPRQVGRRACRDSGDRDASGQCGRGVRSAAGKCPGAVLLFGTLGLPRPRQRRRTPPATRPGLQNDDRSRPAGTAPNAFTPRKRPRPRWGRGRSEHRRRCYLLFAPVPSAGVGRRELLADLARGAGQGDRPDLGGPYIGQARVPFASFTLSVFWWPGAML